MQKTEVTVEVLNSIEETKNILRENGFELVEEWTLNDRYFSKFDKKVLKNMKFIEIINNSILLRQCIGNNIQQNITYKKINVDNLDTVVGEEKINLTIDDVEKARQIFLLAGLNEWCHIEDKNYLYKNNEFEIDLQIVDNLGMFIEFEENEKMKGLSPTQKINIMTSMLKSLGLNLGKDFSYKKAYLKFKSENC